MYFYSQIILFLGQFGFSENFSRKERCSRELLEETSVQNKERSKEWLGEASEYD